MFFHRTKELLAPARTTMGGGSPMGEIDPRGGDRYCGFYLRRGNFTSYASQAMIGRLFIRRCIQKNISFQGIRVQNFALLVEKVPPLGESITEGSISKWMKEVGDDVKVDDVVVVVETDKVTVDIKSSYAGVLAEQLAAATDNVRDYEQLHRVIPHQISFVFTQVFVGKPIFKVETNVVHLEPEDEDKGDRDASSQKPSTPAKESTEKTGTTDTNDQAKSHVRVPLIKFIGKRSLVHKENKESPSPAPPKTVAPVAQENKPAAKKVTKVGSGVDFGSLKGGAWYGRPLLSLEEMDAIDSGGATMIKASSPNKKSLAH